MKNTRRLLLSSALWASLFTASCGSCGENCSDCSDGSCPKPSTAQAGETDPAQPAGTLAVIREEAWGDVKPLHSVGRLYLAGQPSSEDLAKAKEAGVVTVINLRRPSEDAGFDEAKRVEELGMQYVNIPIGAPDTLTPEAIDTAREAIRDAKGSVLIHCRSSNRVGGIYIPWRVLDEGQELDKAIEEAKTAGLHTQGYLDRARAYVEKAQKADRDES